jgi:hypothetical protein
VCAAGCVRAGCAGTICPTGVAVNGIALNYPVLNRGDAAVSRVESLKAGGDVGKIGYGFEQSFFSPTPQLYLSLVTAAENHNDPYPM